MEAVAHPRAPAGGRRARGLPGRFVVARRRVRATPPRSARRSTCPTSWAWRGLAAESGPRTAPRCGSPRDPPPPRARRARRRAGRRGRRARVGARDAAHAPSRRTAACTTRRRARSSCGSASRSRSRSAASACTRATANGSSPARPSTRTAQQTEVAASLPKLDDGTYVVTWRVTSSDSHPIEGAYTFQVGSKATLSQAERAGRRRLVAGGDRRQQDGRRALRHRPRRALRRARAAHRRRRVPRGRVAGAGVTTGARARVVWARLDRRRVTTVLGIALEGRVRRRAAAEQGVRPERVPRRARHALRQGRARAPRAARARVPAAPHAAAPSRPERGAPAARVVAGRGRCSWARASR